MAGTPNDPWAVDSIVPDAQASADDWGVDSVIDDAPKASVGDWDVAEIVADKPVGAPGDSELPPLDLEALGREQEAYEEKNPFFTRMGQRFKRGALGSVVGEHAGNAVTSADTILRAQSDASLSPEERANKITASAENLATSLALFAKTQKSVAGIPEAPVVAAARGRGLKDTLRAASVDPIAFIGEHGATSAFPSAQMGVDAAVGGRLAGKKGAIGSAGLASFNVDYLSGLVESIAEAGVDISDPAAVKQALLNPEFLDAAKKSAGLHASVVGLLDALSIGVASKVLAPAGVKSKLARELINVPPQVAAQGVLGGAGEAGGQLLDKGEVDDWSAVVAEVAGEAVTAPGDVAMAAVGGIREQQAKRRAERQQDQQAVDELNRAYNPDAEPEISVSPDDLYKDTQAAGEPAGQAIEAPEVETTGVEQYIAGAGPGDPVAAIPEVSPGFQEDPAAVAEQPIAPRGTPETSGFEPVNEAGEPEYFDGRLKRSTYRDALVRTLDRDFTEGGGVAVVPDHRYRPGESDKPGERPMIRTPPVNPSWVQSIIGDNGISVAEVKKAAAKSLRGEPLGVRQARVVSQILDQIAEERTSPAEMDAARRQLEDARDVRRWINRDLASAGEIEALAADAPEIARAGELFEESAYGFNQTGVQRVLYEVAEEARARGGDDARIETILDTTRDDAEVLREMVRYTEGLKYATQETRPGKARAQRGPSGDAASVQGAPQPETPRAGEEAVRGETADLIGGKNPAAQAIRDRQEDRKRQERDAPDMGAGPGDLFSGKSKQTDIDDVPGAKERRRDAERRKRVAEMSQDELRRELLTDSLTGLPNRRAYDEAEKLDVQAAIDADSLKWVNDNLGHDAGDKLLQAIGQALAESGLDAYHISGDEFVVQGDDQAALERALDAVRLRLDNARLVAETPDGVTTIKRGIHFSYGIGATRHEADQALNRAKAEREAKGLRAARGKEPPGIERADQGKPPEKDSAPAEVTDKTPSKEGVSASAIDDAARGAATSPDNNLPEPTDAQKEAGNYQKGHVSIHGLDISIENPAGSKRRPEWKPLAHHYGYFKGTVGKDKDHIDVFIGENAEDATLPVFVVDQVNKSGAFDEHKVMLGFESEQAARDGYLANYEDGWTGLGAIKRFTLDEFKLWLKAGDTKKPVALKGKRLMPKSQRKPDGIEDFGETIEGARKHYAETYRDKLREALDADIAAESLSKTWPEPEYDKLLEAGADPWVVAFVHASRDEIPAKPRQSWKLKGWVERVKLLRDIARKMLDGTISKERVQEKLDDKQFARLKTEISGRAELYQAVGHGQSLKGVRVARGSYSIFQGVEHKPAKIIWTVEKKAAATAFSNWPTTLASGDTREDAIANLKKAMESGSLEIKKPADKEVSFAIYSYRRGEKVGRYYIGKKIGKEYVDLESFDSAKTAREYLATNRDRLVEKLRRLKYVPNERKETNDTRVGVDHRHGADVTPAQFSDAFGFLGVQFGNWVEQGKRQQDLNEAYDALMDLAGVLGVPPKALSLNGELGLAFGARGAGAAGVGRGFTPKAHYETGHVVINLTKTKGAGSLAHEWWHALDNYFSRARQDKEGYLTEKAHPRGGGVRPEMVEAFRKVVTTVNESGLRERSSRLDKTRAKPYWSTGREMTARAFESYVIEKLRDQSASNDYLANIVSQAYWEASAQLGLEKAGTYPYPEAAEIPAVRAAFDHFFRTVETKETDDGVALFSRTPRDFAASVDAVLDGAIDEEARIDLGETPAVLRAVGLPDMPLVTTGDVIDKVHYDHGLTRDQIKDLPDLLADPIAVFESDTRPGAFVVVVDTVARGMPVVVAVHPNRRMGRTEVNFLASAYPKQNAAIQLKRWVKAGLLRYINKSRSPAWQTIVGVQFPEMGPAERGSGKIVLTEADVVKADGDPKLSRRAKPGAEPSALARSLTGVAANLEDRARRLEQAGGGFTVTGASLLDDYLDQHKADATDDLRVAKALQDAFGAPVALVASQGTAGFRGVYHQGIIWLNADSGVSLPVVFGHELAHRLENESPGIYRDLRAALGPLLTNTSEYERQYGLDDVSDDTLVSEMIADLMGDRFAEPAFWQQVAANTTSSKFKRIVTVISLWIDKLLARLKGFGSHRFVADLEAARRILANAVRNFAEERSNGQALPQAAPAYARNPDTDDDVAIADLGAPEFHKRIKDWLFDHLKTAKKVNLWSRTVGTQYHLAHKVPAFKPVFDAGQAFLADVSRLAVEAESRAPNLFRQMNTISQAVKTGGASNTDIEAIATPIYTGTVEDQRVYDAAELRDRFKLNPKQIRLYEQALDATHKSLDDMAMASLHRVARAMGLDRAALTRIARRSKSAAEFLERVYRQALKPAREEIDGRIKQLQAIAGAATTDDAKASAQAAIAKIEEKKKRLADDTAGLYKMLARVNQLKSEGYFPLMRFGKYSVDVVSQEGGAPVREAFLTFETEGEANAAARALREEYPESEITQGVMSQDAWRLFPGLTPDVVEAFARQVGVSESDLFQQWLKVAVGNRSAMKRLIKRKNIPGFSKDVNRTLATFILANARLASANYHMPDMLEATQAIPKEMGDVKDQAVMLREYMLNPTEEFARLRSFLFFDFIGGSMASAMVNLTQIPMATFPYLAQGGAVGAARAVAKWMKPGAKPLDAQHAADLQRAEEEGVVSPQEVHNLMAVARGGTLGASRVLSNRHVQTGLYVWGFMFSTAEQYNRRVTFNAAYDVGRSRGVANAYDFAVKAVNESQFIYNRGNRPKWARGIGAPIFTFKQFTISYLELIARMPARQKAMMIALIILAAGVRGLPFEEDIEDLIDTIMQWRGYNWQTKKEMAAWAEETLGKELADFAQHGVSTWLPFDLQGRLGFGNLIPGTAAFKVSETDKSREVSEVLGVSAAVARSVGQGLEKVAKGDPRGAAKVLAPKAVKDFWQGLDMLMDGEYRDPHGNLVTKDVRTVEAVSKMMGLHPRNVAQLQKRNIMAADAKAMHRATEDGIADKWARGIALKDPKLKAEARADLKNYNRKNPGRRIEITERQIMSRVEQMRMDLKKRSVKNTPSELRKDVKRDLGG